MKLDFLLTIVKHSAFGEQTFKRLSHCPYKERFSSEEWESASLGLGGVKFFTE